MLRPTVKFFEKFRYPLAVWLSSRAALVVVVYLGLILIPIAEGEGLWRNFENNLFLDGFARFDSGWYLDIAEKGFTNLPKPGGERDTAFFPAYPLLLSIASPLGKGALHIWGFLLSNLLFAVGLCFLYELSNIYSSERASRLAVCLAAFGPFSIFFSSIYTESLFFASTTASFYFASRFKLFPSMFAASLSAATRVVGIAAVPFAFILYLKHGAWGQHNNIKVSNLGNKKRYIKLGAGLLLGFSFWGLHLVYLQIRFGRFYQFIFSQNADGWLKAAGIRRLVGTWLSVFNVQRFLAGEYYAAGVLNSTMMALCIALVVYGMYRKLLPPSILLWALLVLCGSSRLWLSAGRFSMSVFPIYILAGILMQKLPVSIVVSCSAMLMSLFALVFSHWFWVA